MLTENPINPLVYKVSKVEDTFPPGIIKVILKQDHYNRMTDNVDLMLADYYASAIEPEEPVPEPSSITITHNGSTPKLVIGGSYKTITASSTDGGEIDLTGRWAVTLPEGDEDKFDIQYPQDGQMKISVIKDYDLVGKVISIQYIAPDEVASNVLELEVTAR